MFCIKKEKLSTLLNNIELKNKTIFILISLIVVISCFMLSVKNVYAEKMNDSGFTTPEYNIFAEFKEDNTVNVKENIKTDFYVQKHGIFRVIPIIGEMPVVSDNKLKSNNQDSREMRFAEISDIKVNDKFETSTKSNGVAKVETIKIGSKDKTIIGKKDYNISYKYTIYKSNKKKSKGDYIYYSLLPSKWNSSINRLNVTIILPKKINSKEISLYYGKYGTKNNVIDQANIEYLSDGKMKITFSEQNIEMGSGLSIFTKVPNGYFVNEHTRDGYSLNILLIGLALALISFILWIIFGRDPKMIKPVEFYPPYGIDPLYAGYLLKNEINTQDMSSLYMYMANKGYIKLEINNNKLKDDDISSLKNVDEFDDEDIEIIFTKTANKEQLKNESEYVQMIFESIFRNENIVNYKDLDVDFWEYFLDANILAKKTCHRKVLQFYKNTSDFFSTIEKVFIAIYLLALGFYLWKIGPNNLYGLVGFVATFIISGVGLSITENKKEVIGKGRLIFNYILFNIIGILGVCILAYQTKIAGLGIKTGIIAGIFIIIAMFFQRYEKAKTKEGAAFIGKVIGFKDYLKTAEEDRLRLLVKEEPSYFYDILPYAQVFGISDEWIDKFKTIEVVKPSWAMGNWYGIMWLNTYMYHTNSFTSTGLSNLQDIESNALDDGFGSGGFGSGGFSGGGFGGGGGGSW